jgi:hypothetical protein
MYNDIPRAALAAELKVTKAAVSQWLSPTGRIPEDRCPQIERYSNGSLVCERLRPDLAWVRITDPDWPWHPNGRPLLDLTAAQAVTTNADADTRQAA